MAYHHSSSGKRIEAAIIKYFNHNLFEILQNEAPHAYIIAGGFIHDVLNDKEPNDMDVFIFDIRAFQNIIKNLTEILKCELKFYKSIVEVNHSEFSKTIQLINSSRKDPWVIMDDFDFDYNRAFYYSYAVCAGTNCIRSWQTKKIDNPYGYNSYITKSRFAKALDKGYTFTPKFIKLVFNCDLNEDEITPEKIMELVNSNDDIPSSRKLCDSDIILKTSNTDLALKTFKDTTKKNVLNMILRI